MSKKIWETLPSNVRRKRVQRGIEAESEMISLPSEDDLFTSLSDDMLLIHKENTSTDVNILVLYKRTIDNYYGLLITKYCKCPICSDPIKKCRNGRLLQQLVDRYLSRIVWFDSFISLYNSVPNYSSIPKFAEVVQAYGNTHNLYVAPNFDSNASAILENAEIANEAPNPIHQVNISEFKRVMFELRNALRYIKTNVL